MSRHRSSGRYRSHRGSGGFRYRARGSSNPRDSDRIRYLTYQYQKDGLSFSAARARSFDDVAHGG